MIDETAAPVIADRVVQPEGVPDRLAAQIRFLLEADQLKTVLRRSRLVAADRRENDAEHSWHLALMVLILSEYANETLDVGRTLALVTVHELVEIYAGDTFLYDTAGRIDQAAREQLAAERLFSLLPGDQGAHLRALWDEFEARETPEARFATAMDRLEPLLLNANTKGATWADPNVTADLVRARKKDIAQASTTLWQYGATLIDHAVDEGWLRPGPAPVS